jgi:hypothetical protein
VFLHGWYKRGPNQLCLLDWEFFLNFRQLFHSHFHWDVTSISTWVNAWEQLLEIFVMSDLDLCQTILYSTFVESWHVGLNYDVHGEFEHDLGLAWWFTKSEEVLVVQSVKSRANAGFEYASLTYKPQICTYLYVG